MPKCVRQRELDQCGRGLLLRGTARVVWVRGDGSSLVLCLFNGNLYVLFGLVPVVEVEDIPIYLVFLP